MSRITVKLDDETAKVLNLSSAEALNALLKEYAARLQQDIFVDYLKTLRKDMVPRVLHRYLYEQAVNHPQRDSWTPAERTAYIGKLLREIIYKYNGTGKPA